MSEKIEREIREAQPIAETLERALQSLTTLKPREESSFGKRLIEAGPQRQLAWVSRLLKLEPYHPDVKRIEQGICKFVVGFVKRPERGSRMVLYGTNGNGKSHSARKLVRWVNDWKLELPLVWQTEESFRHPKALFVNWPRRVSEFKQGHWDTNDLLEPELLVIDDIGAEHDPSKMAAEKLYLVLEDRAQRWTLITTNYPPAEWEGRFERRIADRLFRNCEHVDLTRLPSFATQ